MRLQFVKGVFRKRSFTSNVTGSILPFLLTLVVTIGLVVPAESKVNIGNGWETEFGTTNYYWHNNNLRLGYVNQGGQWWDYGKTGWSLLTTGWSTQQFIGDGGAYVMGNTGWLYQYQASTDSSLWWRGGVGLRLGYTYGTGQWWDYGKTGWNSLAGGMSSQFLGDGNARVVGSSDWLYQYQASTDSSLWWRNGIGLRLGYAYSNGTWWDYGRTGWNSLAGGMSSQFIGDGNARVMGSSGWLYQYQAPSDSSWWWRSGVGLRLGYEYSNGKWYNYGKTGWMGLGPSGLSSSFIGDGKWHTMDSLWSYQYYSGMDRGYLNASVRTWSPGTTGDYGSWVSSNTLTCSYTTQNMGLYDTSSTSSAYLYDYNGGSNYSCKWADWNYNISNKSEISAATVFYTGSTVHNVSSWLSWLPVTPNPGFITRTETWDFRNNDLANRYNHEVRAFGNNVWLVQRAQGDIGNCGILASIDSFEAKSGLYVGYTKTWQDTAYAKGWAASSGSTTSAQQASLMNYMGQQFNMPVSTYSGTNANKSLSDLVSLVSQGQKVIIGFDLHGVSEFGSWPLNSGHAVDLVGSATSDGVSYAAITNGWNIQTNTTTLAGLDPKSAYPITYIPFSKLQNAYFSYARIQ